MFHVLNLRLTNFVTSIGNNVLLPNDGVGQIINFFVLSNLCENL